jgi:hypothetical protein
MLRLGTGNAANLGFFAVYVAYSLAIQAVLASVGLGMSTSAPRCPEPQKAKTPRHQLLKFTDCARVVEAFSIHSHHF